MKKKKKHPHSVQLLETMLRHYSPSGEEYALSQFLQEQMSRLGFNVSQDRVGNIIGTVGHGAPEILLCGHMDTVPGEIPVSLKQGRLYGRGAVDAKASLATMIIAAHELSQQNLENRIIVAAVVDEEGEGKGIKNLISRHLTPHYAIFGEPSGSDNIIIGYKGSLTLNFSCKTETGHSAAPWLYENAIERVYDVWGLISDLEFPQEDKSSYFYSVTKCLTKIEGGSMYNIVPHTCHARIDIRVPPQLKPKELKRTIQKKLETWSSKNRPITIKTSWEGGLKGYEADKNSLLVNAFNIAIRKVKRCQGSLLKKTGSSDMNLMAEALAVPMIAYGPGDSRLDHTPNEHILISEYLDGIQVLKEAIITLVSLHSRSA